MKEIYGGLPLDQIVLYISMNLLRQSELDFGNILNFDHVILFISYEKYGRRGLIPILSFVDVVCRMSYVVCHLNCCVVCIMFFRIFDFSPIT